MKCISLPSRSLNISHFLKLISIGKNRIWNLTDSQQSLERLGIRSFLSPKIYSNTALTCSFILRILASSSARFLAKSCCFLRCCSSFSLSSRSFLSRSCCSLASTAFLSLSSRASCTRRILSSLRLLIGEEPGMSIGEVIGVIQNYSKFHLNIIYFAIISCDTA